MTIVRVKMEMAFEPKPEVAEMPELATAFFPATVYPVIEPAPAGFPLDVEKRIVRGTIVTEWIESVVECPEDPAFCRVYTHSGGYFRCNEDAAELIAQIWPYESD